MNFETLRDMENPPRIYVIATGAGSTIQQKLWETPGASAYFVGAQFPYAQEATSEVLGFTPDRFVSPETAMALAHKAYYHALVANRPGPAVGLGMTCSVTSLKEHRGEHRIIAALVTDQLCIYEELPLPKGTGPVTRLNDDYTAMYTAIAFLETALGYRPSAKLDVVDGQALSRKVWFGKGTQYQPHECPLFVPGAFNPFHQGHVNLMLAAQKASGREPILSITANPPHKAHLTVPEMIAKVRQLKDYPVYFNQDPLFIDQARRFPGCSFAIGADALDRMLDPKWCPVDTMLGEFVALDTKFYVSARLVNGRFADLCGVLARRGVTRFWKIFQHVDTPRLDISSTQIREAKS